MNSFIENKDRYIYALAHIKNKEKETLLEHSNRSLAVFDYLSNKNRFLETIEKSFSKDFSRILFESLRFSIFFHDYGKQNILFQVEKMNNKEYSDEGFNEILFTTINNNEAKIRNSNHSKYNLANKLIEYLEYKGIYLNYSGRELKKIKRDLIKFNQNIIEKHHSGFEATSILFNTDIFNKPNITFIMQLFHSYLINSDVIATKYFMEEDTKKITLNEYLNNLFYLDQVLLTEFKTIESKLNYNKDIYLSKGLEKKEDAIKIDSLNNLKKEFGISVINSTNYNSGFLFLKGKVGIGKTNLALLSINEILKKRDQNKVIYVAPLNTLLTQTKEAMEKTMDLKEICPVILNSVERAVIKGHSNLKDSYFFENFNEAILLTSAVNFFEKLFNTKKTDISPLIYLSNAIIVIDEPQLINDKLFNIMYVFLNNLVQYLNCKIIIMSSTLPVPKYIEINLFPKGIPYLIQKESQDDYNSSSFLDRSNFLLDFFDDEHGSSAIKYLIEKDSTSILIVHNSIQKLQNYYSRIKEYIPSDYSVRFYNNNVIKPILNDVLAQVKSGKKIIVFSTKKIETGVDISFQDGIKFMDSFDNIEQFSGRINRHNTFMNSEIIIVKDSKIYFSSQERDVILKKISTNKAITEKYLDNIDAFYKKIFNKDEGGIHIDMFNQHNFIELNKIKLIEQSEKNNFIIDIKFEKISRYLSDELNSLVSKEGLSSSIEIYIRFKYDKRFLQFFDLFKISGYINKKSNFFKTLMQLNKINLSKTKKFDDYWLIIREDSNFFYDLKYGLFSNKVDDNMLEIEDLINE